MNSEPSLEMEQRVCKQRFKLGDPFSSLLLLTLGVKGQVRCQQPCTRRLYQHCEGEKVHFILA